MAAASSDVALYVPGLPAGLSALGWHELVELGRYVADSASQWMLGDLACRVAGDAQYGEHMLGKYAETIGVPLRTLQDYRRVAAAYPQMSRRRDISWGVHREIATLDDRAEVIPSRGSWTVKEARDLVASRRTVTLPPGPAAVEPGPVEPAVKATLKPLTGGWEEFTAPEPAAPEPAVPVVAVTTVTEPPAPVPQPVITPALAPMVITKRPDTAADWAEVNRQLADRAETKLGEHHRSEVARLERRVATLEASLAAFRGLPASLLALAWPCPYHRETAEKWRKSLEESIWTCAQCGVPGGS